MEMEWYYVILIMVGSIAALMMLGVPVAFAFLGVNIVGSFLFMGGVNGLNLVVANAASRVTVFTLAPIPLFMLMGELFFRTGLALKVFDTFDLLLGRLPGRLAYLTVGGGTFFSALTGSSLANTAMLGTLMLPEMQRRGYKRHMAMGPIMGTGGLAMIIPPSGLAVLLGSIANVDVGALLVAGFLPESCSPRSTRRRSSCRSASTRMLRRNTSTSRCRFPPSCGPSSSTSSRWGW